MHKTGLNIALGLLLSIGFIWGSETDPAAILKISSKNKKYLAVVKTEVKPGSKKKTIEKHTLYVYKIIGKKKRLMWKTNFEFTGYYGGILSDKGNVFCYVDFRHNQDTHVVLINKTERLVFHSVYNQKKIKSKNLLKRAAHGIQIHEGGVPGSYFNRRESENLTELITLEGKKYLVDGQTGVVTH